VEQPYTVNQIREIITPIARAHGVGSVSLFGSYASGTADGSSDVDLKIEKGEVRSLFQLCGLRLAFEDALQLPVDLVTSESSDQEFLKQIGKEEVLLYRNT
jgi:predicted nucleotidyltransferase